MLTEIDEIKRSMIALRSELSSNKPDLGSIVLSSTSLLIVDLETGVIAMSTALADSMFGYISGELVGKSIHMLVPPDLRSRHEQHFANYGEQPESRQMGDHDMILLGSRRDGTTFPLEISLHPHAWGGRRYVVATLLKTREPAQP